MAIPEIWLWVGFTLFILAMLGVDLGVMQRRPHVIGMPEALAWFGVWMGLALLFNIGVLVWHPRGGAAGLEFLTGFLVEKSLSVDNVFVFILIFRYFRVPAAYQHKVLFWGIVGAIVLRVLFIVGGIALMERFHWTMYVFGAFLVATGLSMMRQREAEYDPAQELGGPPVSPLLPGDSRFSSRPVFHSAGRAVVGDAVVRDAAGD
jgi:Membrane protein TerC, possibly involved in tellurium resistance